MRVTVRDVESILSTSSILRSDPKRRVCSPEEAAFEVAVGLDEGTRFERASRAVEVSDVMEGASCDKNCGRNDSESSEREIYLERRRNR